MSGKTWDCIIEHAKTCILTDTQHVFYPDESHSIGVILNTIYQPLGIVRDGTYIHSSYLSDTEKVCAVLFFVLFCVPQLMLTDICGSFK